MKRLVCSIYIIVLTVFTLVGCAQKTAIEEQKLPVKSMIFSDTVQTALSSISITDDEFNIIPFEGIEDLDSEIYTSDIKNTLMENCFEKKYERASPLVLFVGKKSNKAIIFFEEISGRHVIKYLNLVDDEWEVHIELKDNV